MVFLLPDATFASIALGFGLFFFIFATRYYIFTATIFVMQLYHSLRGSSRPSGNGNGNGHNGNGNGSNGNRNGYSRNGTNGNGNGLSAGLLGFLHAKNHGGHNGNGNDNGHGHTNGNANGNGSGNGNGNGSQIGAGFCNYQAEPFVSIQLPFYNERNVADRILTACMKLDYPNYEVIVIDDSNDETLRILENWKSAYDSVTQAPLVGSAGTQLLVSLQRPALKIVHRENRHGFKGGALNEALKIMDPRAEFVIVLDADFVPPSNLVRSFLSYVEVADAVTVINRILKLDREFSRGELSIERYLEERESLLAQVAGKHSKKGLLKAARTAISHLDEIHASSKIGLEEYLRRRQLIIRMLERLGAGTIEYGPLDERSRVLKSFEVDQLLASGKIEPAEYAKKLRTVKSAPAAEFSSNLAGQISIQDVLRLDRLFADRKISDQEWYAAERKWLFDRLILSEGDRKNLIDNFDVDQKFANGLISRDEYVDVRMGIREKAGNRRGNGNGDGNGNGNGNNGNGKTNGNGKRIFPILWRGRRGGGRNGNGNSNHNGNGNHHNGNGNGNGKNGNANGKVVAVQGYQWHTLNKSENWLTQGVRAEYSGSYVIERTCQEIFGAMKMIAGSVYMIRAEALRKYGWSTSITEDWELTCRLYRDGERVAYTPLIQVPAEIPSTLTRLIRQRQRWAEGHTYNAKKYFWQILKSKHVSLREKAEFVYFAPYYLQSLFFIVGSAFWLVSETVHEYVPFWTAVFGWSLLLSNLIAIPLMDLAGLFAEGTTRRDFAGIASAIILSYMLSPFQGYAALTGLLEKEEGTWVRTFKTGKITDPFLRLRLRSVLRRLRPKKTDGRRASRAVEHSSRYSKPSVRDKPSHKKRSVFGLVLLAGLSLGLVGAIFASSFVPEAKAIPANTKWFFNGIGGTADPPPRGGSPGICNDIAQLSTTKTQPASFSLAGSGTTLGFYCWITNISNTVSSADSGTWVFHFVWTSNTYAAGSTVTVRVYLSATSTNVLGTQVGSGTVVPAGASGTADVNIPVTISVSGPFFIQFSYFSNAATTTSLTMDGNSTTGSYLIVPEGLLPILLLFPFFTFLHRRISNRKLTARKA